MPVMEGRFYFPFSTRVAGKPVIVYPARDENPLSDVLSRQELGAIERHIQQLTCLTPVFAEADYSLVVVWNLDGTVMTDVWSFSLENFSAAGPLVHVDTYKGYEPAEAGSGVAAGDGLILLGREEEYRRACPSLAYYLDRSRGLPDFPRGLVSDEPFDLATSASDLLP